MIDCCDGGKVYVEGMKKIDRCTLSVYEPLESLEYSDYWKVYVEGYEVFREKCVDQIKIANRIREEYWKKLKDYRIKQQYPIREEFQKRWDVIGKEYRDKEWDLIQHPIGKQYEKKLVAIKIEYEERKTLVDKEHWNQFLVWSREECAIWREHQNRLRDFIEKHHLIMERYKKELEEYILKKSKVKAVDWQPKAKAAGCDMLVPLIDFHVCPWHFAEWFYERTSEERIPLPNAHYFTEEDKIYIAPLDSHKYTWEDTLPIVWLLLFRDPDEKYYSDRDNLQYKTHLKEALQNCEDRLELLSNYSSMQDFHREGENLLNKLSIYDKAGFVILDHIRLVSFHTYIRLGNSRRIDEIKKLIYGPKD